MILFTLLLLVVPGVLCKTVPIHYNVLLIPDLNNSAFKTETTIIFFVEEVTDIFTLNVRNLAIQEVAVTAGGQSVPFSWHDEINNDTLIIKLENLTVYDLYDISIKSSGEISHKHEGLYMFKYNTTEDSDREEKTLLLADFRYNKARTVFPCVDDPLEPSTFTLSIVRPLEFRSISNMAQTSSTTYDATHMKDSFAKTGRIPTYLLSFILCDYHSSPQDYTHVHMCTPDSGQAVEMAKFSKSALEKFEEMYFFNFDKVDHVVVPEGALSRDVLESIGLVIYRESSFFFDTEYDSVEDKQRLARIVSHAVAKQSKKKTTNFDWSPNWWKSEGLISFYQYEILSEMRTVSSWDLLGQFLVDEMEDLLHDDVANDVVSVVLIEGQTPHDFTERHVATSFALVRMFTGFPTPEVILESETSPIAHSWINNPGHPILAVNRELNNYEFNFVQSGPTIRHIPIAVFFENDLYNYQKFTDVVDTMSLTFNFTDHLASSWFIVNRDRLGYYRVNYGSRNWASLISFLTNSQNDVHEISPTTRGVLIEDAFYYASINRLNISVYLELIQYLKQEQDYVPIFAFIKTAKKMNSLLTNTTVQSRFMEFSVNLLQEMYDVIGTTYSPSEDHLITLGRINILTFLCSFGLEKCNQEMHEWLERREAVPGNLQDLVYCGGMRRGTLEHFHFLKDQHLLHKKKRILRSMACTPNYEILRYYISAIIDISPIWQMEPEDKIDAFKAVLDGSEVGVDVALDFVKQYLELFLARFSVDEVEEMLTALSKKLVTSEHEQKIDAIIDCLSDEHKLQFEALFTTVKANIVFNKEWQNAQVRAIESWLDTFNTITTTPTTTTTTTTTTTPAPTTPRPGGGGGAVDLRSPLVLLTFFLSFFILFHN